MLIRHNQEKLSNKNYYSVPDEIKSLGIITIQKNGDITTNSPEFVGGLNTELNNFVVGNINAQCELDEGGLVYDKRRFLFVMKAIAENNLWDEVAIYFDEKGHKEIPVFTYQIEMLKEAFNEQLRWGETINKRGHRFLRSTSCGPKYPPRPPEH